MTKSNGALRATLACFALLIASRVSAAPPKLELAKGNKIVMIGNTLAERMQYFGHFETLLHARFPNLELVFRDLGWSADELTLRPRSLDFQDHGHKLEDHQPDVILAAFGFNESFAGEKGLPKFRSDLEAFIRETTSTKYNGKSAPKLVVLSPIAHENLKRRELPDGQANNRNIALYTKAMAEIAENAGVTFVDLFAPSKKLMESASEPLTINGIHLNDAGDRLIGAALDEALFGARPAEEKVSLESLREAVQEKNRQFFFDYRAVNGYYIYGGRKNPFGVVNFPAEFQKLRKMIEVRDRRVWAIAQGNTPPASIDDSQTGEFASIETNVPQEITITSPATTLSRFKLQDGYEANLFASEEEFPDLKNPVQFSFDARGRLWVVTMPSYPMYLPGTPVNDKVLIFEDTNGDGKADKQTVFADGLHVPTGIELGDGGAYVAQQPNLMFLKDTNGDDKADIREYVLHGFDSADSHHSISAFCWDPGGALYFEEGTFHHTQVETPYGPERVKDAAVFRYEPRTGRFGVFVSYGFANPWGHCWDKWGQNFVADASGGANYYGTAFSGDVDYPDKHGGMEQFLKMQWRPTSGCEFVSSRNFPDEAQGNYLLNNCIGFQGVLQYKTREQDSGFVAEPVEPLLQCSDPNFRPVDLEFGPDGALYLVDWFNPLIGHMQHSLRDPKRDTTHGRIWRIRYKNRPLVDPPLIADQTLAHLLDLLKLPEDRARSRARVELRSRNTREVLRSLESWTAALDKADPDYWRMMLESLWVKQHHDVVDPTLLKTLLNCPEYRARAAAVRVLCYWRDRVPDVLDLLRARAEDEHPRVRLETVRACSFFRGADVPAAQEIALLTLLAPQDYYLKYTLDETNRTLDKRAKAQ